MPPPDSNPPRQDYSGGGSLQQSSQPEEPEIARDSIMPQSSYDEPAQSYGGAREIVDSPEVPTVEAPAYVGLNYDPDNIAGAEEGGFHVS
jgi:hypothetical protein